jgi:hypothetical protein
MHLASAKLSKMDTKTQRVGTRLKTYVYVLKCVLLIFTPKINPFKTAIVSYISNK